MASIARSKVASSALDERNRKEVLFDPFCCLAPFMGTHRYCVRRGVAFCPSQRKHGDSPMAASSPNPAVMIGLDGVPGRKCSVLVSSDLT